MRIAKASKKGRRCHDLRIETPRLQSGKTEGALGKAHRQSLRKQLQRCGKTRHGLNTHRRGRARRAAGDARADGSARAARSVAGAIFALVAAALLGWNVGPLKL